MESSELSESSDSAVYSDFEFFLPSSDGNFIFLSPDAEPIVCKKHISSNSIHNTILFKLSLKLENPARGA